MKNSFNSDFTNMERMKRLEIKPYELQHGENDEVVRERMAQLSESLEQRRCLCREQVLENNFL